MIIEPDTMYVLLGLRKQLRLACKQICRQNIRAIDFIVNRKLTNALWARPFEKVRKSDIGQRKRRYLFKHEENLLERLEIVFVLT